MTLRSPPAADLVFFHRKPIHHISFGIEQMFESIRMALPDSLSPRVVVARFDSVGVWRRVLNLVEAGFRQGDVNHITGDIHYAALLLRKRRTLLTVHDCGFEARLTGWRVMLYKLLWLRIPIGRVALVATDSEYSKSRILAHTQCCPDKVVVIPACVSSVFERRDKPFNRLHPTILQVGTVGNKNLDRVIDALVGIDCHFRIVGLLTTEQRSKLERSGLDWSNARGLSETELVDTYAASDIVMFASTYEGFGLPIVEANTVGRPVVTSNLTSMPEVAGGSACLVDPFDVGSIRDGVLRLIEDDRYRESLIAVGVENCARFSATISAAGYVDLYQRLLPPGDRLRRTPRRLAQQTMAWFRSGRRGLGRGAQRGRGTGGRRAQSTQSSRYGVPDTHVS